MAIISLSDNALFQIAACWMLPLAYLVVRLIRMCIKFVRLHVLPVARLRVLEATLVPSTNNSNAVPLRLNATECQLPSNAVPPVMSLSIWLVVPRAWAEAAPVASLSPMCARLFFVDELEIARAASEPKSVPPLK